MTTQEARKAISWFCGCGSPELALTALRDILAIHPLYDHQEELKTLLPNGGVQYLVLYMLSHLDLTEHGGSVGGGWLTDKGKGLLEAIKRDGIETIADSDICIDGYTDAEQCPECAKLNAKT